MSVAVVNTPRDVPHLNRPICGAKNKKTRQPCRGAAMENGRCRVHGGLSRKGAASGTFKDGKHSKYTYLPPILTARVENMTLDLVDNLEESVKILRARETQLHEKAGTGESSEAWVKLKQAVKDYQDAEFGDKETKALDQAKAFGMIKFIVEEGLSETFLWRDIQSLHESQRKLSETAAKIRVQQQETYTKEQWDVMLNIIMNLLRNLFPDGNQLGQFANAIAAYGRREPKQISGRTD